MYDINKCQRKLKGTINNGQSRNTDNIGHTTQNKEKQNNGLSRNTDNIGHKTQNKEKQNNGQSRNTDNIGHKTQNKANRTMVNLETQTTLATRHKTKLTEN